MIVIHEMRLLMKKDEQFTLAAPISEDRMRVQLCSANMRCLQLMLRRSRAAACIYSLHLHRLSVCPSQLHGTDTQFWMYSVLSQNRKNIYVSSAPSLPTDYIQNEIGVGRGGPLFQLSSCLKCDPSPTPELMRLLDFSILCTGFHSILVARAGGCYCCT